MPVLVDRDLGHVADGPAIALAERARGESDGADVLQPGSGVADLHELLLAILGAIGVVSSIAERGTSAMRAQSFFANGNATAIIHPDLGEGDMLYFRAWMFVGAATPITTFTELHTIGHRGGDHTHLIFNNEVGDFTSSYLAVTTPGGDFVTDFAFFPRDRWVCVQTNVLLSAKGAGSVELVVDDVAVATVSGTSTLETPELVDFELGIPVANQDAPLDIFYDEVVLDTDPIGCEP